jgi:hypothetical protein
VGGRIRVNVLTVGRYLGLIPGVAFGAGAISVREFWVLFNTVVPAEG